MKNSRILLLLALTVFLFVLLAGCAAGAAEIPQLPTAAGEPQPAAAPEDPPAVLPPETVAAAPPPSVPEIPGTEPVTLSEEEAQSIALTHAGFAPEQVSRLRTHYEIDDGIPHYDVEFHRDRWEYDYEIHAETGQILSFEKDD